MAKENRILFVEGADDQHTIWAICEHFKIEKTFTIEIPDRTGKINRKARPTELGGIDNVLKATQLYLIAGSGAVERIGIIIDADDNINARWQSVASILSKAGFTNLPTSPNSDGTIIKQEFLPIFGVWIMPDNQIERGYLETFLTFLVPENDIAWGHAKNSVAALEEKPFVKVKADYTTKAEIHTFLAWQEEPGKPFGQAITAKYLRADNPNCKKFVEWLNHLFVD
ncbi:MAG TPA: DUF3226 domain-containing protein [Pyrinomonadaceae bacterium]|jgi:hypothetical protein